MSQIKDHIIGLEIDMLLLIKCKRIILCLNELGDKYKIFESNEDGPEFYFLMLEYDKSKTISSSFKMSSETIETIDMIYNQIYSNIFPFNITVLTKLSPNNSILYFLIDSSLNYKVSNNVERDKISYQNKYLSVPIIRRICGKMLKNYNNTYVNKMDLESDERNESYIIVLNSDSKLYVGLFFKDYFYKIIQHIILQMKYAEIDIYYG